MFKFINVMTLIIRNYYYRTQKAQKSQKFIDLLEIPMADIQ